jgi:hypothetical protein
MRRIMLTSLALAAAVAALVLPPAAPADTPMTLTRLGAHWSSSTNKIWIDTRWAPKSFETRVTVKISVNGEPLRTLQVKRWVIGRKLFKLTVPESVPDDSKARIEVRVQSKAGTDHRAVSLDLTVDDDPPPAA